MARAKPITGLNPRAPTGKNARIIAKIRLEEMYSWDKYVDNPSKIRELHNLRIAAKRVRYTLEVFEEFLPEGCRPIVKELEQIQEELGSLHDSDVMIALLHVCLANRGRTSDFVAAVSAAESKQKRERVVVEPELVATLADLTVTPSAEERYGLQQLLLKQEQLREQRYAAFREHWDQLRARDFRREILAVLDA